MADDKSAPVVEDSAAVQAKSAQEAENARWQDDFNEDEINIPYKREDKDDAAKSDDDKDDDAGVAGVDDKADEPVEVYSDPAPVVTVEDPGEYTPADYSFEVTDKDGKTVKISTPAEADKFADDDENFKSARDLKDFLSKAGKMETKLDRDHDKWEAQKEQYDTQVETQQEREQTVQNLVNGFEYLIAKGLMPKLDPADAVADWNDPEVAKHDGVKEQIELINYMTKENASREKAGIPVLASALDAFNSWQLDTNRKQQEQEHKQAGEQRRAAGAKVASVSSSGQSPYVPKGIAVGRVLPTRGSAQWED